VAKQTIRCWRTKIMGLTGEELEEKDNMKPVLLE
jgi:hypothetical protein